jgi:hypothetical protein
MEEQDSHWKRFGLELPLLLWAVWEYAGEITRLLTNGAGVDEISIALGGFREHIGVEPDDAHDRHAAVRLRNWWYWRFESSAD